MTSPKTNYYNFPPFSPPPHYFSPPPPPAAKPPSHSTLPPPPHVKPPPPPPHVKPPPPPPHVNPPPPPHVFPPPPSPSPDNNPTVIVFLFVSLGCLFFLAFLSVALCCFLQKKMEKKMVEETDIIRVDEHLKVKEAVVPAPHGEQAVVLLVDEDVHIQEQIKKNEVVGQAHHSQGKSAKGIISSTAIGKKQKKMIQERDSVNIDEHLKVKEGMLAGPHGAQTLALSVEDDRHIHEAIEKNERVSDGLHGTSSKGFVYSIEKKLLGAFGKGKKKMIQEIEVINADEHSMLKEEIIAGGSRGEQVALVIKENDVHIQDEIRKIEKLGEGLHGNITCATEKP